MATKKAVFSASSPNFWANIVTFVLALGALGGINWGMSPEILGDKLVTSLTGGSLWAVVGITVTNILTPIYYVIKNKSFSLSLTSTNFWAQVITFGLSLGVTYGIEFDTESADALVGAVAAKDWGLLFTIALAAIVQPLIRYIKSRNA